MKCPKCGFISFDFNQVCPKCNRDLAEAQRILNLPSFRPNPPEILGSLTGEAFDSDVGIQQIPHTISKGPEPVKNVGMEDSFRGLADDKSAYGEDDDLDLLSLEPDDSEQSFSMSSEEPEDEELSLDLEDISLEESKKEASPPDTQQEEDILDLLIKDDAEAVELQDEDSPLDILASRSDTAVMEKEIAEEAAVFSLDDISFDDLDIDENQPSELTVEDISTDEDGHSENISPIDTMFLVDNAEGLTKEIDMTKFRKDGAKGDDKAE